MIREFILTRSKTDDGFNIGNRQNDMWDVCAESLYKHFPLVTDKVDRVRVLVADCPDLIDEPTLEAFWYSEKTDYASEYYFMDIDDCEEEIMDDVASILGRHFKQGEPMYIYAEPMV